MRRFAYSIAFLFFTASFLHSKVITVTTTRDAGSGSLRDAIEQVNAGSGNDTIVFDIGSGIQTIFLASGLPPIKVSGTTIDGTTQPGFSGKPLIVIDGSGAGLASGLVLHAVDTCIVKSLVIGNFLRSGIEIRGQGNNSIFGCYIGTDATGMNEAPNAHHAISITGSSHTTIGGYTSLERNVLSGNKRSGIAIASSLLHPSNGTVIKGNYIGVTSTGQAGLPNNHRGIQINAFSNPRQYSTGTIISNNIISANLSDGIFLGQHAAGTLIKNNFIGTASQGIFALTNNRYGIYSKSSKALEIESLNTNILPSNTCNHLFIEDEPGLKIAPSNPVQVNEVKIHKQAPLLSASLKAAKNVLCVGQGTTLTLSIQGVGPFTLAWSDTPTAQESITTPLIHRSIHPSTTTTYFARITDASGSSITCPTITVHVHKSSIRLTADKNALCAGQSALLTATFIGQPRTLHWSDGVVHHKPISPVKRIVKPSTTTVYTVTAQSAYGCKSSSGPISVTVSPPLTAHIHVKKECICHGDCTTLRVTIGGGIPPFKLLWSDKAKPITTTKRSIERRICPIKDSRYTLRVIDKHNHAVLAQSKITMCKIRRSKRS